MSMRRVVWSPLLPDGSLDPKEADRPSRTRAPTLWEATAPTFGVSLGRTVRQVWVQARACPRHVFRLLCTAPKQMPDTQWPPNVVAAVGTLRTQAEVDEAVPALLALPAMQREVVLTPKEAIHLHPEWLQTSCPCGWTSSRGDSPLEGHLCPACGDEDSREVEPIVTAIRVRGGAGTTCKEPMAVAWVHSLRDQAVDAGVDFSLSWGRWVPNPSGDDSPPDGQRAYRFPHIDPDSWFLKSMKTSGLLDGRDWSER